MRSPVSVLPLLSVAVLLVIGGAVYAGPYDDAVLADSPFLYYRFEESVGSGTAIDSAPIGGAQNGTYLDSLPSNLGQPSASVELGSSGLFDGNNDRIDLPGLGSYSQHSIEMWINTNGLAGGCCTSLYSTDTWTTDGGGSSLHYNIKSGRDIEHAMHNGGPNNVNTPGGVIQDGNWYHVVATYDATAGGDVEIYINGVPQTLNAAGHSAGNNLNLGTGGEIGTWNVGRDFRGNIDEVAMYASVLSPAQVLAHYNAANVLPPPPPPPLTYHFDGPDDQGWTDVLTSSAPNANTDWNTVTSWPRGPAERGDGGVAPGTGANPNGWNQRDGANDPFVFRSPAFTLDTGEISFYLFGGMPNGPAPANFSDLGVGPRTDFLGLALRDDSTGAYVIAKGKTGNGDFWEKVTFTAAELAPYVGGVYTLDLIDDKDDGWGWGLLDSVTVPMRATIIPEPATLLVWSLLAALGIGCWGWRRRK